MRNERNGIQFPYVLGRTTKYPSGTSSLYPGGRIRYLPPLPLSAPVMPTSATQRYQKSSMSPSTSGGISTTRWPSCVSSQTKLYTVAVGAMNALFAQVDA